MFEELITTKELCFRLGLSSSTIDNYRKRGLPVEIKRPRVVRYNYQAVVNWLKNPTDMSEAKS